MTVSRPNLDFLRKSAKDLKRAFARGDADAARRVHAVFGDRPGTGSLADALHVIAREQGHDSWPRLKLDIEIKLADRSERAGRLADALLHGRLRVAERILALDPEIAADSLPLRLALYDESALAAFEADPGRLAAAERCGDSRLALDALTRVATSQYFRLRPDLAPVQEGMVQRLIELGADPDARYANPDAPDQPLSVLYGCLCVAGNLPLAEVLLTAGADPNDNESAYHATEMETLDALRLLMRFGVKLEGTNALFRMLDFDNYEGAALMLDYGADANEHLGHGGNALRHAIRRGRDGRFADLLIANGARGDAPDGGRSAYALAAVHGNASMIEALERHGLRTTLDSNDRFLAAVAGGRRREAVELWAGDKDIVARLPRADRRLHIAFAAQDGRLETLELMNEVGFDPQETDFEGMTALHVAAWHGRTDYVRFYLSLDPDRSHRNRYGGTALGSAVHGSQNCPRREGGDHVGTVRALVEAGYEIEPGFIALGSDAVTALLDDRMAETEDVQTAG